MTATTTTTATVPTRTVVVPLVVLVALGLMRTALLLGTDGISYLGFRLTGSNQPLTYALLGANVWIVPVDLVTLLVVARLLVREGTSLRRLLDLKPFGRTVGWGLLAFVLLLVGFLIATFVGNLVPPGPAPAGISTVRSRSTGCGRSRHALTVAVAEEFLYRATCSPGSRRGSAASPAWSSWPR